MAIQDVREHDDARASDRVGDMPGYLVRRLQQLAVSIFAEETTRTGVEVTPVQYSALKTIQKRPGIDQATLARAIAQDRATVGGVIDRLEARGYVARYADERDRRVWRLRLLPEGGRACTRLDPAVNRAQERLLAPLAEEERDMFLDYIRAIIGQADGADPGVQG